jgi:hypothetical protein
MMSKTASELNFEAEGADGQRFSFESKRGNGHAKIVLVIDAMIGADSITRLQQFVSALTWMFGEAPILEGAVDIVPLVALKRVAELGSKDMVRGVISQVLRRLHLSTESVGQTVVLDWNGDAVESIRLSIARIGDPHAIAADSHVPEFEKHALWILVSDQENTACSAAFAVPIPAEPAEFTGFVNDVIAAAPSAEAQNAIAEVFGKYYAAHPL